jgi:hypothetical protein
MERESEAETEKIESALQKALSSILLYRALFFSIRRENVPEGECVFLPMKKNPGK